MNNRVKVLFHFIVIYTRYFANLLITISKGKIKNKSTGIIFSMDRPLQLNALLESYFEFCDNPEPLVVLFKSSSGKFDKGYDDVIYIFEKTHQVTFIRENDFKDDLLNILKTTKTYFLFFLVDDNLFLSNFNLNDYYQYCNFNIFSMRMGKNIIYSYTHDLTLDLPKFKNLNGFLSWKWQNGGYEWGYPFSVDGNIYITEMVLKMAKSINFKGPNSFEAQMNRFRFVFYFIPGLCLNKSLLVNLNLNRVQNEISNKAGEISTSDLLKAWDEGYKIEYSEYKNGNFNSCHIESNDIKLISRL